MPELSNTQVRELYGLKQSSMSRIILNTLQHILNNIIDSVVSGQHDSLHDDHPWLPALLLTIEIAILFGCVNANAFWDIMESELSTRETIVNTNLFTSVSSGLGKIRIWIRLSVMDKSLHLQLKECHFKLCSIMTKQSVLSSNFRQFTQLLSSLDILDIKLYVQERDISKDRIPFDRIFIENEDQLDLSVCGIVIPSIITKNIDINNLQTALRHQVCQRIHYQQECKRLQEKVADLEQQLDTLLKGNLDKVIALKLSLLEARLEQSELAREHLRKRLLLK